MATYPLKELLSRWQLGNLDCRASHWADFTASLSPREAEQTIEIKTAAQAVIKRGLGQISFYDKPRLTIEMPSRGLI